jgi:hypothetical protein
MVTNRKTSTIKSKSGKTYTYKYSTVTIENDAQKLAKKYCKEHGLKLNFFISKVLKEYLENL